MNAKNIAEQLYWNYSDYYWTCIFECIVEAVENTFKDLTGQELTLEKIHKHIIENYI